ncbi:MAG: carboxypeptidase regulatory-like domain-containing protein [Planctomycetes bacterium]|nr:carboxypeptidase regulatory-like domain-containing protein [Planctomycetota bacterium]
MNKRNLVAVAALAAFVATTLWAGSAVAEDNCAISGKVTFKGDKPKRTKLNLAADPFCVTYYKDRGKKGIGTENVIVNKDGSLRNVAVYIKQGLGDRTFDVPAQAAVIDQVGCHYKPHVLAMMKGQTLTVKNSDDTLHNIHGLCKKNAEFNFGQPKAGLTKDLTFKKEEAFKVKCDVHPWMGAYVVVLNHPFFDVTGKQGTFTLATLPPGDYVVEAWHEEYGTTTQKVSVSEGQTQEIEFVFEPN